MTTSPTGMARYQLAIQPRFSRVSYHMSLLAAEIKSTVYVASGRGHREQ